MAVMVRNRRGKKVTLLNPAEKGQKYACELGNNVRLTNDGSIKFRKNGKPKHLSDTAKSYRAGYLQARKDNAKAYKHNKKKKAVARTTTAKKKR